MGLLDMVIGQVLARRGGLGGALGGAVGDALGGALARGGSGRGRAKSGGMSPLMIALLALLASKAIRSRGGLGGILGDLFGRGSELPEDQPRGIPQGEPSGRPLPQPDPSGSWGDAPSGGSFGRSNPSGIDTSVLYTPGTSSGPQDPSGRVGEPGGSDRSMTPQPGGSGLGGGMLGGLVGAGLDGLIDAFRRSGHGDVIDSWVGRGHNRQIAPNELASVLGDDTVSVLEQQTGLPRAQLLSELSDTLPEVVDQLTPEGRAPDDDELSRW